MKVLLLIFISLLFTTGIKASANSQRVHHLEWNGLDVVWIEENRYPTYNLSVYYADGALSDSKSRAGETELMFNLLDIGTTRYSEQQIADALDFYGVSYGGNVTHEFSTFSLSGLTKDIVPTLKMVCHIVNEATYPKKILSRKKRIIMNKIHSMVNSKGELASKAFRDLSLSGTPYELSTAGKLKTLRRINRNNLLAKRKYFQNKVKKVLYITGPKEILNIKDIINKECGWKNQNNLFVRKIDYKEKKFSGPKIYLVTVPKANQAQVRIGRFLNKSEIGSDELMTLSSHFLGGGFTSQLMREVRVKRGLTYSISAFAAAQAEYGRVGISTFTKNETIDKLLQVIKTTLEDSMNKKFTKESFDRAKGYLVGSYPFRFEKAGSYLNQLISLDHVGKPYDQLYNFPSVVKNLSEDDVAREIKRLFSWKDQTIVVVGDKSLFKKLKKLGKVKVYSYKRFL
jgi:zinc protease